MDKVYTAHEFAYQKLKNKGAKSWHEMYATPEGKNVDHVGFSRRLFIEDILEKDWCPKSGNALEIGCGTGHLINFIKEKGFNSFGVEISKTATELAKEQHKNIAFTNGDYCYDQIYENDFFDLIIDGSCFHCIVEDKDREKFIAQTKKLLKKDGVFIMMTMSSPINKINFKKQFKTQKLKNEIFYVKYDKELEGSKVFDNELYMSQRRIPHWKSVLKMLKDNGFNDQIFKYEQGEVFSSLYISMKK